ncbi:HIT domain-containing protein [Candidatus Giovannonibacteria bacterium]|nr:HIT domain-containing protein [Candidatus Giovannonibacteria bacterium]
MSEFRKDIVSGDWILVASGSAKRPHFLKEDRRKKTSIKKCPFEDPQKSGNGDALFWRPLPTASGENREKFSSWFVQVVKNKFPILNPHKVCPVTVKNGSEQSFGGVGFHEIVVTRNHARSLGFMTREELKLVLETYRERYRALSSEKCVEYVLIYHNNGLKAGATVGHPHSQIVALPIIPTDVKRSLDGSSRYYEKHKRCVHCTVIKDESRAKKRVIYKNKHFIVICPYASHVSAEIRLFPITHNPRFEDMHEAQYDSFVEAVRVVFAKLNKALHDPDYNFFIHTAPPKSKNYKHYHWHFEILPRTNIWGGVELGTGIEVVRILPENAAKILRAAKV